MNNDSINSLPYFSQRKIGVFFCVLGLGWVSTLGSSCLITSFWLFLLLWLLSRIIVSVSCVFFMTFLTYSLPIFSIVLPLYRFLPVVLVVSMGIVASAYVAVQVGMLFWLLSLCGKTSYRYVRSFIFLWSWFYFLTHYSLWLFGSAEGLLFLHPMRSCIVSHCMCRCIALVGYDTVLFFLLACLSGIVWLLELKSYASVIVVFACCWLVINRLVPSSIDQGIGLPCSLQAPMLSFSSENPESSFSVLSQLSKLVQSDSMQTISEPKLFLFPESALPDDCTNAYMMSGLTQICSDNTAILIGSYHKTSAGYANAAFGFSSQGCVGIYDKSHRVACAERFPAVVLFVAQLFGYQPVPFFAGDGTVVPFSFFSFSIVPILCSELFFTNRLARITLQYPDCSCIALVNDGWFSGSIFPKILRDTAQLQVVAAGAPLIYVSYLYRGWFSSFGTWHAL